ncbi:hypothetical protein [Microlunatus sp. Gsoil 973]|uniref:hypothetical protein n=1 Tax=Microlunatus sp. Gsoil 973 TaxID=2672569 RepID=UPI0012B4D8BD|nr:hypothetical protein [Microlunatus sp. Gsoil 973]QGN33957.1 hypothetical protein GJV80_15295 [Microlunatus sp. Gsoil 973]
MLSCSEAAAVTEAVLRRVPGVELLTLSVEMTGGAPRLRLHAREWVGGQQVAVVLGLVEGDRRDGDPLFDRSWWVWRNWSGPVFASSSLGWVLVEVTAGRVHYPPGFERSHDHPVATSGAATGS